MAKLCIAGALDLSEKDNQEFAEYLGRAVVRHGHVLLNGCRNDFDKVVAQSAQDELTLEGLEPTQNIISYVVDDGNELIHRYGTIRKSRLKDWDITFKRLHVPEPIHLADAVIVVGGTEGTMRAANWARIDKKPILPVKVFGGAAEELYNEEIKEFESSGYSEYVERNEYEILNQIPSDLEKLATAIVSLAERLLSSRDVFVVMSYTKDPKLEDAYESFKEICDEYQYKCGRVDNTTLVNRIVPEIFIRINTAAFVIVDLTDEKANVYYELGLAQGIKKPVIITAFKGTILPFDVADIPTIFWEGQKQLKGRLREKIGIIASTQGR